MKRQNSYDRNAQTPKVGSKWVWELDNPGARELIEVVTVKWNGEEWWIETKTLLPAYGWLEDQPTYWNDLGRFSEACTLVRKY